MNYIARLFLGSVPLICFLLTGITSRAASAQASCPPEVTTEAGKKPAMSIKGNPALIVCGTPEATEKWKSKILLSGFEVYSLKLKAKLKMLLQYSELERALVSKKGQELKVETMIYFRKEWVPAFQFNYSRKGSVWKKSEEKLILKLPQKLNGEEVRESDELLAKAKTQKSMDEMEIAKIF